jgi:3-deoxy-D-manno-octulosonate 8-phosphate phosphatase (KDO 8-P phosphatase)
MAFRNSYGIPEKIKRIKLLIVDVDGVLTDGKSYIMPDGREMKIFCVKDGSGIVMGHRAGIKTAIISGRSSPVVNSWAKTQGIKYVFQKVFHKIDVFEKLKKKYELKAEEIAFIGDDMIDIPLLKKVGLSITVADGAKDLRDEVDFITSAGGGQGAVREVMELILKTQKKWKKATEVYFRK